MFILLENIRNSRTEAFRKNASPRQPYPARKDDRRFRNHSCSSERRLPFGTVSLPMEQTAPNRSVRRRPHESCDASGRRPSPGNDIMPPIPPVFFRLPERHPTETAPTPGPRLTAGRAIKKPAAFRRPPALPVVSEPRLNRAGVRHTTIPR